MRLKKLYQYIYYKIYKFYEAVSMFPRGFDWSSSIAMCILAYSVFFSLWNYYNIFIDRTARINKIIIIIVGISIAIFDYYMFDNKSKWKKIIKEFDKLPRKKNILGGWLVFLFICAVIANLIFSFYLMSQIDWSVYK